MVLSKSPIHEQAQPKCTNFLFCPKQHLFHCLSNVYGPNQLTLWLSELQIQYLKPTNCWEFDKSSMEQIFQIHLNLILFRLEKCTPAVREAWSSRHNGGEILRTPLNPYRDVKRGSGGHQLGPHDAERRQSSGRLTIVVLPHGIPIWNIMHKQWKAFLFQERRLNPINLYF